MRDDSGVYEGWEVPIFYDPMISKLATWGATRGEAIGRMKRALGEYHVGGIRTTIPFFLAALEDAEFVSGEIDTGYIARFLERQTAREPDTEAEVAAMPEVAAMIVAAMSYAEREQGKQRAAVSSTPAVSRWKRAAGWRQ